MNECYICSIRGALKSPCKAWDKLLFFSLDKAKTFLGFAKKNCREAVVFRCSLEVVEENENCYLITEYLGDDTEDLFFSLEQAKDEQDLDKQLGFKTNIFKCKILVGEEIV